VTATTWCSRIGILGLPKAKPGFTASFPAPSAVLELLKPVTRFPPMWAYACGVVSSGAPIVEIKYIALVGMILAGPLVCAMR
jgi:chlorophyll synthase